MESLPLVQMHGQVGEPQLWAPCGLDTPTLRLDRVDASPSQGLSDKQDRSGELKVKAGGEGIAFIKHFV